AFQRVEFQRARGERQFLLPRRPLRRAFAEREPAADVREAPGVRSLVQRGGARDRHPRPVSTEGGRLLHPREDRQDRQALRENARRRRALQGRDPDQQPRGRRPRLYLYCRPREYWHAYPAAHRSRPRDREVLKAMAGKSVLARLDRVVDDFSRRTRYFREELTKG